MLEKGTKSSSSGKRIVALNSYPSIINLQSLTGVCGLVCGTEITTSSRKGNKFLFIVTLNVSDPEKSLNSFLVNRHFRNTRARSSPFSVVTTPYPSANIQTSQRHDLTRSSKAPTSTTLYWLGLAALKDLAPGVYEGSIWK